MSYVNSVAIGVIFIQFWVPQQCYVTSVQTQRTHWAPNSTFVFTFPTTQHFTLTRIHYFIHHFTFSFSQTHSRATTEAHLFADQHLQHSSVNRFCFRWGPYSAPPFVGFYFDFFVFSMFLILHFHVPPFFVLCLLRP